MTILLRAGERMRASSPIRSRFGPGMFCVTDRAAACEIDGRGLYLDFVPRGSITALRELGRSRSGSRLRLEWREKETHGFEFRASDPSCLLAELARHAPSSSS